MRFLWTLLLIPIAGCAMDGEFLAPPPPQMAGYAPQASSCAPPPVANSCSGGIRPASYYSPLPQTQEPPR